MGRAGPSWLELVTKNLPLGARIPNAPGNSAGREAAQPLRRRREATSERVIDR